MAYSLHTGTLRKKSSGRAVSLRRSCHFKPTHLVARTFPADARSPAASLMEVALWLSSNEDHTVSFATQFSLTFFKVCFEEFEEFEESNTGASSSALGWLPEWPPMEAALLRELQRVTGASYYELLPLWT